MTEASDWFNLAFISWSIFIFLYSFSSHSHFTACFMGGHYMLINKLEFVKRLLWFLSVAKSLLKIG